MSLEDAALRVLENLSDRPEGPLGFRFLVQPLMASIVAIRDGIRDGRTGAPPFFLAIILPSEHQAQSFRSGIRATTRVMIFALLLDMAYQIFLFSAVYIGEALVVAFTLGFLPYLLLRGPVARLTGYLIARGHANGD